MKKSTLTFFRLVVLLALSGFACNREECCTLPAGEKVEFYLLSDYVTDTASYGGILDPRIESSPYINYKDIIAYDPENYTFTLSKEAIVKIVAIQQPVAFALAVDRKIIYAGFFRQRFLSSSCDCIWIDTNGPAIRPNKIEVELGYAATKNLSDIDTRNDLLLLNTLRKDGKLGQ